MSLTLKFITSYDIKSTQVITIQHTIITFKHFIFGYLGI